MQVRSWLGGVVFGAIIAAGVGIAYASVPDSKGVIHGCYNNTSYALRVLDTAKTAKCPTGMTALTWNQKGVPGPSGTTIDARPRATAPLQIPLALLFQDVWVTVPMTPSSWSQAANEVQQPYGQISFTSPATCTTPPNGPSPGDPVTPQVTEQVSIDGQGVSVVSFPGTLGQRTTKNVTFQNQQLFLFEPGAVTTHTVSVQVHQNCAAANEHITLNGFAIDIAGMR